MRNKPDNRNKPQALEKTFRYHIYRILRAMILCVEHRNLPFGMPYTL
ncbi:MAG: hypothetical protein LBD29_07745 [Treponema sp.]|nr:hypothetical protein [Treponema sp.]